MMRRSTQSPMKAEDGSGQLTTAKSPLPIPFTKPARTGRELTYVKEAIENDELAGGGRFLQACEAILQSETGCEGVLLTNSCTSALEMSLLLVDIGVGDEVIMPSHTFASTANAVALRGAVPVFVDIKGDTLNIDASKIEAAITPRTRAIMPVHYAGVACEMVSISEIAARHELAVIEDAAQGLCATYNGRPLGTIGQLGTLSFHATKNVVAGEGGALLVNDPNLIERAQNIREKGTNRRRFLNGDVDKYTWVELGSAYLPAEMSAAYLLAQLEEAKVITKNRLRLWNRYHQELKPLADQEFLTRPTVPAGCDHNGHIYYVLLPDSRGRNAVLQSLNQQGIGATTHFVPLDQAPAGAAFARTVDNLTVTQDAAGRLLRLPLFHDLTTQDQDRVLEALSDAVRAQ